MAERKSKRRGRPPADYNGRYCILNVWCALNRFESDKPICCHDCLRKDDCHKACQNDPERCNCVTRNLPRGADEIFILKGGRRSAL